jgi:Tol biopolymer transport system component
MGKVHPHVRIAPQKEEVAGERLDSWKEIANYLSRDVRTVARWEENEGLPVYRHAKSRLKGSAVYAYKSEIDAWLKRKPPLPPEAQGKQQPVPTPLEENGVKTRRVFWIAASLLVLIAGGLVTWRILRQQSPEQPLRVVTLTAYPGVERFPTFSPDGKQVVFTWNGPKQDNPDLYLKLLNGGGPLRLTTHPGIDGWASWSPDGRLIVFARWVLGAKTFEALTMDPLGGSVRKIYEEQVPVQPSGYWPIFCWTPDSREIIGPIFASKNPPMALALISLRTLEVKRLTEPIPGSPGDCSPAMSPDGRTLAFLRAVSGRVWNLYLLPLGPDYRPISQPRQLTAEPAGVENPMWTANGRELLYITTREGEKTLWRVPVDGSRPPSQIESIGPIGSFWAISQGGDQLAYSDITINRDIWRIGLGGEKNVSQVFSSSKDDLAPKIAPDGKQIAFVSVRENGRRLWVAGANGENPIDLAPISYGGLPSWSPDGKQIAFDCQNEENNDDICSVPAGGGAVRRLTRDPARDLLPSWSRDGKWIYITSNRSGTLQIWKVPSDGSERGAVQLTKGSGFNAVESVDGETVYFSRERTASSVWKIAAAGGEEQQVGDFRFSLHYSNFAVGRNGIYYIYSEEPERSFDIFLYRFSTGKSERISRVNKLLWTGICVSPDERYLLFTASESGSADLHMVENFR